MPMSHVVAMFFWEVAELPRYNIQIRVVIFNLACSVIHHLLLFFRSPSFFLAIPHATTQSVLLASLSEAQYLNYSYLLTLL